MPKHTLLAFLITSLTVSASAQTPGGVTLGFPTSSLNNWPLPPLTSQFYAGEVVRGSLVYNSTAQNPNFPEQTGIFRMTAPASSGNNSLTNYKMALGAETTGGGPTSNWLWGMTTVLNITAGYPAATQGQVIHEFDGNFNSGANCADGDEGVAGAAPCDATLVAVSGNSQIRAGLSITGSNLIRNGIQINTAGALAASVRDYSQSQVTYKDTGQHINGFDGSAAIYSGKFINGPGAFSVDGSGNLAAPVVQGTIVVANGNLRAPFGTVATSSSACTPGQLQVDASYIYTCVAVNSWHRISNGTPWP